MPFICMYNGKTSRLEQVTSHNRKNCSSGTFYLEERETSVISNYLLWRDVKRDCSEIHFLVAFNARKHKEYT